MKKAVSGRVIIDVAVRLRKVTVTVTGSEEAFDDPYVEQLQQFIRGIKGSREMEERFMIFEEMLKAERAAGDSSTKNLDADRFPVKNIGRIYTEDVIHI